VLGGSDRYIATTIALSSEVAAMRRKVLLSTAVCVGLLSTFLGASPASATAQSWKYFGYYGSRAGCLVAGYHLQLKTVIDRFYCEQIFVGYGLWGNTI
jgi:hypothetical protein